MSCGCSSALLEVEWPQTESGEIRDREMFRSDEPLADGFGDRFGLRAHVELPVNTSKVHVHGVQGDVELIGDFFFDVPLDHGTKHFLFALGERFGLFDRSEFGKAIENHAGDRSTEWRGSIHDIANAFDDVIRVGSFKQVAGCAIADGAIDALTVIEGSEDDDLLLGKLGFHFVEDLKAVLSW